MQITVANENRIFAKLWLCDMIKWQRAPHGFSFNISGNVSAFMGIFRFLDPFILSVDFSMHMKNIFFQNINTIKKEWAPLNMLYATICEKVRVFQ